MDLVAFVIAADEGIMPQTVEHFEICRLLGVRDGLIALLTKRDLVEPDWLDMVIEEVGEFFRGSFLEERADRGRGLDQPHRHRRDRPPARRTGGGPGLPRVRPVPLAVDRVFSMKGSAR